MLDKVCKTNSTLPKLKIELKILQAFQNYVIQTLQ